MNKMTHVVQMRFCAALIAVTPLTSGCVMAVRQVAHEANRNNAEADARREFLVGEPQNQIRTSMTAKGYLCEDLPVPDDRAFKMSCGISHPRRTAGTFLVGGNWRYEFAGYDGKLTRVHTSGRKRAPTASPTAQKKV